MNKDRFHRVTGCGIARLGVDSNVPRFFEIGLFVNIDMTNPFAVTQYWN